MTKPEHAPSDEAGPPLPWGKANGTTSAAAQAVAKSADQARPPGSAHGSATTESDLVHAGRLEQGVVKPGKEVVSLPTHTAPSPCTGKVFSVEMLHQRLDQACPGDNVALNIKGLDKNNMPESGLVLAGRML